MFNLIMFEKPKIAKLEKEKGVKMSSKLFQKFEEDFNKAVEIEITKHPHLDLIGCVGILKKKVKIKNNGYSAVPISVNEPILGSIEIDVWNWTEIL